MTVWSLTPLFNELDLLEVRLRELDEVVDVHVISEAETTYAGEAKPLHFVDHRERFEPWLDRIRYVVADRPDPTPMQRSGDRRRWGRENGQRAALGDALDGMKPNDIVLLSDMDEIPRAEWIKGLHAHPIQGVIAPAIPMHLYRVGLRIVEPQPSLLRAARGKVLTGKTPEDFRRERSRPPVGRAPRPEDAVTRFGWHLSYAGGVEAIRYKVRNAAHPEEDVADWLRVERLIECIAEGQDHRGNRRHHLELAPEYGWPRAIRENPDRFRTLIDPLRWPAETL